MRQEPGAALRVGNAASESHSGVPSLALLEASGPATHSWLCLVSDQEDLGHSVQGQEISAPRGTLTSARVKVGGAVQDDEMQEQG